ncbi:lantibiotic dehydratase [Mucilaginibacter sp. BJC16-A38]|uniref:lantibiotic dehydratase n=1 Tax=Mucilaginibacter phenanthrenivorans TaxID=1234842 RepID=UPI002157E010|nr:lantibiotic dehydratase [Mucilaginibacter phenanthrenivorans]MCR8560355.1 lantibiotic dehydratase [Mucilaginibacter phenanthrenivorans]
MSYHFADYLLLRLPTYPAIEYSEDPETVLNSPFFRAALYLASPVFYGRLKATGFSPANLSAKELATVLKYYNRCCFRPTPFGFFASVSLVTWGKGGIELTSTNNLIASLQPDQGYVNRASGNLLSKTGSKPKFEANPTLYRVLKDYRFISTEVGDDGKRVYQLQSTDYSLVLKNILQFCRQPRTVAQIVQRIGRLANTSPEDSEDYLLFLIDSQVLIPETRINITGENYLNRIINGISDQVNAPAQPAKKLTINLPYSSITVPDLINYRRNLRHFAEKELTNDDHQEISAVLLRQMAGAQLDLSFQDTIRNGINALNKLCLPDELPAMNQFRSGFLKYFEGQRIPLMEALDPERGIGYQEAASAHPNELLETVKLHSVSPAAPKNFWSSVHVYLMEGWLNMEIKKDNIIRLDTEGLNKLSSSNEIYTPLGISVLFRIAEGKVLMEAVGGNNALALAGRFTVSGDDIAAAVRYMAKEQEDLNPNLIFAEILHVTDPHIDNVNRRGHIWSHELPLTAASTLDAGQQLELGDMFVEISGDQVFLWSEKQKKYVIPRLSTAYNHHINKLPLFRFLADLPYQFGRANFNFQLQNYFPGLAYYPRVEYHNCILSPATWLIDEITLLALRELNGEELQSAFSGLVKKLKIPEFFALTDGDQQLIFQSDSLKDILLFKEVTRQRTELMLTEFTVEHAGSALVRDEQGRAFVNQFSAFLLPDLPLALPDGQWPVVGSTATKSRKFMPGSEWLYLKIYSPKIGASKLLLKLWPLIDRKYSNGSINKWFFIRYHDHAPHIRLRLKIDPKDISEILLAFRASLEGHIEQHVVREYQLDVYNRELERYQAAGIELTEDFFWASSLFVKEYLRRNSEKKGLPPYLAAVATVKIITGEILTDEGDQKAFFLNCYRQMMTEFEGKNAKQQLDLKYREFGPAIYQALHNADFLQMHGLAAAVRNLVKHTAPLKQALRGQDNELHTYLHSILHMHLNRLFTDQQRLQEMIIYFLLFKHLNSEEGRKKQRH